MWHTSSPWESQHTDVATDSTRSIKSPTKESERNERRLRLALLPRRGMLIEVANELLLHFLLLHPLYQPVEWFIRLKLINIVIPRRSPYEHSKDEILGYKISIERMLEGCYP